MHKKYGWTREILDDIADVCFSLTKFHLRLHPLREEDRSYYYKVLAAIRVRAEKKKKEGCERQRCYRHCRDQMEMALMGKMQILFLAMIVLDLLLLKLLLLILFMILLVVVLDEM